jgi:hypothetical protein
MHMTWLASAWGGEDNDFHARVKRDPNMTIIRQNEKGLLHMWHDRNCSLVVEFSEQKVACLASKATHLG